MPPPQMDPPASGARVRMYRPHGLGDCFLLAFPGGGGRGRYVLIDCGVFFRTPNADVRMRAIAEDIRAATGNRLDVLVATHEHYDHLSGFEFAEDVFRAMDIGEVWVAWTEDPRHPVARRLRDERDRALRALTAVAARFGEAQDERAEEISEVLSFFGGVRLGARAGSLGADTGRPISGTAEQMALVHELGRRSGGGLRYCRPGQPPLRVAGAPGVQAYVLGPPEDVASVRRSRPRGDEVYERPQGLSDGPLALGVSDAFFAAVLSGEEGADPGRPFGSAGALPLDEAAAEEGSFFYARYGNGNDADGEGAAWRRIGDEWMGAAERLALALDTHTNNTSLVLAFELDGGAVLLFPGDAQVGNWLSWGDVAWEGGATRVSGADLLRRAVLYKVGHHASHNATLRERGLELMGRDDELVALMPVDEAQAKQKRWAMPFPPLYERLQEKTRGRVLRADVGVPERPEGVSGREWEVFLTRVREDSGPEALWIEVDVPG